MMLLKPQWKDMQSKRFLSGGLKMAANGIEIDLVANLKTKKYDNI
jgi:hypothetical protein